MNGDDKKYLTIELTRLKTQFDERWRAHDIGAHERQRTYLTKFDSLHESLGEFKNQTMDILKHLNLLPCGENKAETKALKREVDSIKTNDLKHLNIKINAILITVVLGALGSLIVIGLKTLGFKF